MFLYFSRTIVYNSFGKVYKSDVLEIQHSEGRNVMLTYTLDISKDSRWLRTTPGTVALAQPYYVTEAGLFYAGQHFITERSDKDSYLIFYTFSGEGFLTQEGSTLRLVPGSALILDCRRPQRYGTAPGSDHWHHCWVHADGSGVAALFSMINPGGKPAAIPVHDAIRERFTHLMRRIPQETASAVLSASLDVHRILQDMASASLHDETERRHSHQDLMEAAAEYIREHYAEDVHIGTLLGITHVSRSYFLRLFRQYMGTTPYNFLLLTRITRAKEMLETTDLPVAEIAYEVGFQGDANFSSRFLAITGVTPGQYRRQALRSQAGAGQ